jgi:lipoprotein NlpI
LAQRRIADAKLTLKRIDALQGANRDGNESLDPYLEILRLLATEEATKKRESPTDSQEWPSPILAFLDGKISEKELVLSSYRRDGQIDREKLCEALFYMGLHQAIEGRSRSARAHFRAVVSLQVKQFFEYAVAATLID